MHFEGRRQHRRRKTRHDTYVHARARAVTDKNRGLHSPMPGFDPRRRLFVLACFAKKIISVCILFLLLCFAYVFAGLLRVRKDSSSLGVVGKTAVSTEGLQCIQWRRQTITENKADAETPDATHAVLQTRSEDIR